MNKKEEQIQKALGTFDHLKCAECGKISHKPSCAIRIYETIREIAGTSFFQECVGIEYRCPSCGSKNFE